MAWDAGLVTVPGEAGKTYAGQVGYDAGGGRSKVQMGSTQWETRQYNGRKQVVGIRLGASESGAR